MKLVRVFVVTALVTSLAALAVPGASAKQSADSQPCTKRLISSHEGYTAHADGDTVAAQRAAFKIGANIADSDVWVTKDGYIVQMHDEDVSYSTDGTGLVPEMTLNQILALRTTRHNNPIPTLDDSLAIPIAHQAGRYFMFESKLSFFDKDYLQMLADQIDAAGMTDHTIIYSNYPMQVRTLERIDPGLITWYKAVGKVPSLSKVAGLDGVMIPAGLLTKAVVDEFHAAGLTVIRERIDQETAAAWQHFVATGADGLMTAHPRTVIAYCRALP